MTTSDPASPATHSRWAYVFATMTAVAVFPLIFVGAGVTSKDAGMAYPDWPTSGGHLVNPPDWSQQEDTRWEHGHRLIGWTVGMFAIALAVAGWRRGGTVRRLAIATLLAIIIQGVLGGLRVRGNSTPLALMHGIWGQLCFCLACVTALAASRKWHPVDIASATRTSLFTRRLTLAMAATIFIQLVLGAVIRHFNSDHALAAHLIWVIVVAFGVGWSTLWIMAHHERMTFLVRLVQFIAVLFAIQIMLGAFAFLLTNMAVRDSGAMAWLVPTAHVAVGALLLALSVVLAVAARRHLRLGDTTEAVPEPAGLVTS